jgi:hypothetical protein
MRGYAKIASVGLLMMGLLAVPNLSLATDRDGNGRHSLLNAELRSKIEHLRDKMANHREDYHNQGDLAGGLAALQTEVANLKAALAAMVNNEASLLLQLNDAKTRLTTLETNPPSGGSTNPALTELAKYVKVDPNPINGLTGPHVIFHHANVHVESGSAPTALPGLGNLIVGYNEMPTIQGWSRAGSHNLIVGPSHSFSSTAGAVFGVSNVISAEHATILGGNQNRAGGTSSSILGGFGLVVNGTEETYP